MTSQKDNIRRILREETEEFNMINYLYSNTINEINEKLIPITSQMENEWLNGLYVVGMDYKPKLNFLVDLKSDYNYDLTFCLEYLNGSIVKSYIQHDIKEWEYDLKDVEVIRGFENLKPDFYKIVKVVTDEITHLTLKLLRKTLK